MKRCIAALVLAVFGCQSAMTPSQDKVEKPGLRFFHGPIDWVTGGGEIEPTPGDTASFGFEAKERQEGVEGNLVYIDPAQDLKLKSTEVLTYRVVDDWTREFTGTAVVTQDSTEIPATYTVTVADNGEPGRDDTFAITIEVKDQRTYTASGTLVGGNIQLHERRVRIRPGAPALPDSVP